MKRFQFDKESFPKCVTGTEPIQKRRFDCIESAQTTSDLVTV